MRNHNEKARDMSRSVLPSSPRRRARAARQQIRQGERAHERRVVHALRAAIDPDDVEGPLGDVHRREVARMVYERRQADKVGPLIRWAERTIAGDPQLSGASPQDQAAHFRHLLPQGLIGNHAVSHLRWTFDRRTGSTSARTAPTDAAAKPDLAVVVAILAAGLQGELNRHIKSRSAWMLYTDRERCRPSVPGDDYRLLHGAHDVEAFVADASKPLMRAVRAFHGETVGS